MLHLLARGMQLVGLAALPLAIVLELADAVSLWQMLTLAVSGITAFWLGRMLEGYFGEGAKRDQR